VISLGDENTPPQVRENVGMSRKDERKALMIVGDHHDEFLVEMEANSWLRYKSVSGRLKKRN